MEYTCKNSRKSKPITIFLGDLNMRMQSPGKDEVVHYSAVKNVIIKKNASGVYTTELVTIENNRYALSNLYAADDGTLQDKSVAYALFVRVLHMHLKTKSKAQFKCMHSFHIPDWQKLALVILLFAISYLLDYLGYKLFHPAIHGVALSGIALLLLALSERNKGIENALKGEIPTEYLPG